MKYLCLVYAKEATGVPRADEREAFMAEVGKWDDYLRQRGLHASSYGLESTQTATTVRVRAGRVSVTDGPFAETKEALVGLDLIDARDLDEALQVAQRNPMARRGSIEVRPIRGSKQV